MTEDATTMAHQIPESPKFQRQGKVKANGIWIPQRLIRVIIMGGIVSAAPIRERPRTMPKAIVGKNNEVILR